VVLLTVLETTYICCNLKFQNCHCVKTVLCMLKMFLVEFNINFVESKVLPLLFIFLILSTLYNHHYLVFSIHQSYISDGLGRLPAW
jgi:hypothetical protein